MIRVAPPANCRLVVRNVTLGATDRSAPPESEFQAHSALNAIAWQLLNDGWSLRRDDRLQRLTLRRGDLCVQLWIEHVYAGPRGRV